MLDGWYTRGTVNRDFRPITAGAGMWRRFILFALPLWILVSCSDGDRSPLDLDPQPDDPGLSGTEMTIDFDEFADGDTVTSVDGVGVTLPSRGVRCADAVVAFDSGLPHGEGEDDLDLSSPNETFGGWGRGAGGESGQKFANERPLGRLLVIQEDPTLPDVNPSPADNCVDGGTVRFDFGALYPSGLAVKSVVLIDVDTRREANGTSVRLYGAGDILLDSFQPPVTGSNGVVNLGLGPTPNVLRLEIEEDVTLGASIAIGRIEIVVPDSTG